jgi:hypothetical protein
MSNLRRAEEILPRVRPIIEQMLQLIIPDLARTIPDDLFEPGREEELFEASAVAMLCLLEEERVLAEPEKQAKLVYQMFCLNPTFDKIEEMHDRVVKIQDRLFEAGVIKRVVIREIGPGIFGASLRR